MRLVRLSCVVVGVLVLILVAAGCVHTRELTLAVKPLPNPTTGPAVRVISVTDLRKFEAEPADDTVPRVRDTSQTGDRAVTSKAIGFARGGGHRTYYVLTDQTVESLVQASVQNALRIKGYRVVEAGSPDAAAAVPVEVGVRKFWFVMDAGFVKLKGTTDVEVEVKSAVLVNAAGAECAAGQHHLSAPVFVDSMIRRTIYGALDEMRDKVKGQLKDTQ